MFTPVIYTCDFPAKTNQSVCCEKDLCTFNFIQRKCDEDGKRLTGCTTNAGYTLLMYSSPFHLCRIQTGG